MGLFENTFGEVVRKRRHELGLSQEALGFRSALHRTYISEIERGQKAPSLRAMLALAQALDTNVSTLILTTEEQVAARSIVRDEV